MFLIFGVFCFKLFWVVLIVVDMFINKIVWEVLLGSVDKMLSLLVFWDLGMFGVGGFLVIVGGLVFIGYLLDDILKVFDFFMGKLLWEGDLLVVGIFVFVSYEVDGE